MHGTNLRGFGKRPLTWVVVLAILVVGGLSLTVVRGLFQARQVEEVVEPPPEQVSVAALGRIEPGEGVVNVAAAESGRIAKLLVQEGDQVEAGDVLAYLDLYEVRLAERDLAASQAAEAQNQLVAERSFGQAQVQEASTRRQQVDQPQAFAIEAQQATVERLEKELDLAELDLARIEGLVAAGALAQQDLDRQQSETEQTRENLDNARATLRQLEEQRNSSMKNADAQLQSAQASVQRSEAQVQLDSALSNLQLAEARLAQTIIRAPITGQVLEIFADPGEAVAPGAETPVLVMGDTNQMYVVAEVYETDVGLVRPGQTATITSRNGAFAETLTGQVEEIGLQIFKNDVLDDDPAANADARVVEVRIRVNQSEAVAQLTNLQVDVQIDIKS